MCFFFFEKNLNRIEGVLTPPHTITQTRGHPPAYGAPQPTHSHIHICLPLNMIKFSRGIQIPQKAPFQNIFKDLHIFAKPLKTRGKGPSLFHVSRDTV